jgi:transcriptional regulator with XRE-family HTH domain
MNNQDILTATGTRLAALREERGMSVNKLAKLAGIAESQIRFLENGERIMGFVSLYRVAKALGVGLDDLVREK